MSCGAIGGFIRRIDAGEFADLAGARLDVQALGIAALALLQRSRQIDLDELRVADALADLVAIGAERRDEGGDHDEAGVDEQRRHLADAADVLVAPAFGEIEILVEPVADVVAVQQIAVVAALHQRLLERVGDRGLARARQAREPHHGGLLALLVGADRGGDARRLPHHVGARARGLRCGAMTMPAPTVPKCSRSTMMNEPVARLSL